MKKVLCLALTAVFVCLFCVTAFAADAYTPYTHKTQGYFLEYPSDWLMLDASYVAAIMKSDSSLSAFPNVDVASYAKQILSSDMVMFIKEDRDNINIVSQYIGQAFSADVLAAELIPSLAEQYRQIMPGVEMIVEGDVLEVEEREFAYVIYKWNNGQGEIIGVQLMNCDTENLLYFTLSCNDTKDTAEFIRNFKQLKHMLETFEF